MWTASIAPRVDIFYYWFLISKLFHDFIQEAVKEKEEQCANFRQLLLEKEDEIMQLEKVVVAVYHVTH